MMKAYCSCQKCVALCSNLPGIFKPDEVKKAAELLRMPLKDFLKKHCIVGV